MRQCLKKLCAILLIVTYGGAKEVTVEDGRYHGLVVSFLQNIQPDDGKILLENLKESLNEASLVLSNAIGLHFAKVTVQIPPAWDTSELSITEAGTKPLESDFVVDGAEDVVFGKFPHAEQYGGCGEPGHRIVIPTAFFAENNTFPKGTALAREWLKYRYGVFDENGYLQDPLYPLYYVIPGGDLNDVKVTDCTGVPVTYDFVDKNSGEDCSSLDTTVFQNLNAGRCDIRLHNASLENVTSSIMYYQKDIDAMQNICVEENHNSLSPNKQNVLCSGQSIWEVVKKSSDFKAGTMADFGEIEFAYVQQTKPKVVIAWEDTFPMKKKKAVIINAVQQIVIDLPLGSQFASFHFNDKLAVDSNYELHELNVLADKISVMTAVASDFVSGTEDVNINLAIFKAFEILSNAAGDSKAEGTIIIITRSGGTLDETLVEKLKDSDVCVKIMLLTDDTTPDDVHTTLDLPCATVNKISMEVDKETFKDLYDGMQQFLPSVVDDKETKTVEIGYLTQESTLKIQVDDSSETVTFWVYRNRQTENFVLKFNNEIKTNEIKTTGIGDVKQMVYSVPEKGEIEFSYPHEEELPILTQIKVTSKPGEYFTGDVLIHDTTKGISEQMPVIIYAVVRYGAYPVQNAVVSATINTPDNKNITMDLNDDGRGDPDITRNDGIYSRYFIDFSVVGDYIVTVTVKNRGDLTSYGIDENSDYKPCCGSSVNGETPKLKQFSKEFVTTFKTNSERPEDGYTPSKIFDLRVDEVTDDKLTLKWTAPGAEADHGAAQSYEIKHFTSQDETKNFDIGTALEYTAAPQEGGKTENFEIKFSDFGKSGLHYIAMKAKNANKTSLSNIVEISVPEDTTTGEPDGGDDNELKKGSTKNKTIGIIVGVIVAVIALIILIYLAIYFVVVKPKRKEEQKKENKQSERIEVPAMRNDTAMNSITFIPASTIMDHHNEKTKAKLENKEPPIFKEEDFIDRNSQYTNDSGEGGNAQSERVNKNGQPNLPPKSPKRTTPV